MFDHRQPYLLPTPIYITNFSAMEVHMVSAVCYSKPIWMGHKTNRILFQIALACRKQLLCVRTGEFCNRLGTKDAEEINSLR